MDIVITTLGRPTKQKALSQIPASFYDRVRIFTKEAEVKELQANVPDGIKVLSLPDDTDGIADTRQRAIDALPKGKVWVMDDLCRFKKRIEANGKYTNQIIGEGDFERMYARVEELLDTYFQVAISPQLHNNRKPNVVTIGRAYSCYGLRTDVMQRANIRFDAMYQRDKQCRYMEDFYITLDGLTKGYANAVLYEYCFEYVHNSPGGNSLNRTLEGHARSAIMLAELFPGVITLKKKQGQWGMIKNMNERTEIMAQWRKAYKLGKKARR